MKTDNEIIAEFMGFKRNIFEPCVYIIPNSFCSKKIFMMPDELEFNSSWGWLMPVVIAIEEIEETHPSNNPERGTVWPYQVEILSRNTVQIIDNITDTAIITVNNDRLSKLESLYQAVVEFIKWYNQQKK